jgi:hypothetical protein
MYFISVPFYNGYRCNRWNLDIFQFVIVPINLVSHGGNLHIFHTSLKGLDLLLFVCHQLVPSKLINLFCQIHSNCCNKTMNIKSLMFLVLQWFIFYKTNTKWLIWLKLFYVKHKHCRYFCVIRLHDHLKWSSPI